ncbi:hypothetical protein [Agrobacterium deltaense]|uniref:hypothetical protein n=1 Tax=Agrobacterium deltaense TaxID=1183412 RepID=UPI000F6444B8|nr:hypothetical protein [Agrobacterium deltaense]RRN67620.1 hypothetical protein EIQ31_22285 [Agrobacterium deltaense]
MRDKVDTWAFLLRRSKWPNRIVLLLCCAVFVSLLFQAYAITIPSPSLWLNVVNAGRGAIGIDPINPWRDWLYDFQSLIGGILAVIAAAFTVLQMRISDDRSEARHKEALKLQVRADSLRFERMFFPLHDELVVGLRVFSRGFSAENLKSLFDEINGACYDIDRAFKAQTYRDAEDLLGGTLTIAIAQYRTDIIELRRLAQIAGEFNFAEEPQSEDSRKRRDEYLAQIGNFCLHVRRGTGRLTLDLQGLLQRYTDG